MANRHWCAMIDTHIHIDLFKDPIGASKLLNSSLWAAVAVTMLPSHYSLSIKHLSRYSRIYPAIGAHPLRAREAARELPQWLNEFHSAKFIGEIGLDRSKEGKPTFDQQIDVFKLVLRQISAGSFVTVHSRSAENETLNLLNDMSVGPACFHYFTGGKEALQKVIDSGHYISINHKILNSAKHRTMVNSIPEDKLLLESDAPFLGLRPVEQLRTTAEEIAKLRAVDTESVISSTCDNFQRCRTN